MIGIKEDLVLTSERDLHSLVFGANERTKQLQFIIKDDKIPELDESFLILFLDADCCVPLNKPLTATIVIVDNDRGMYCYITMLTVASCTCTCASMKVILELTMALRSL